MKEIKKKEDAFILADIDLRKGMISYSTYWVGFRNKCEVREPRFVKLRGLFIFEDLGYDIIIFDELSAKKWYKRFMGKGIFHKQFMKNHYPSIFKADLCLSSVEEPGFTSIDTEIGKKLHRKRPSRREKILINNKFDHQCYLCLSRKNLSIHHILARQFGGGTEEKNLVTLCNKCHVKIHKNEIDDIKLQRLRYQS